MSALQYSVNEASLSLWRRWRANGLSVSPLPSLCDVDTMADAAHVATLAPTTRFARALAAVTS